MKKYLGWMMIFLGGGNVVVGLEIIFQAHSAVFISQNLAAAYGFVVCLVGLFLIAVGGWAAVKNK